jgi:hypothetical protein
MKGITRSPKSDMTNMALHPREAITRMPTRGPHKEPVPIPTPLIVRRKRLLTRGVYSDTMAIVVGVMVAIPIPARNLKAAKRPMLVWIEAHRAVKTEKKETAIKRTVFLPSLSVNIPNRMAPAIAPQREALPRTPLTAAPICSSFIIVGKVLPKIC